MDATYPDAGLVHRENQARGRMLSFQKGEHTVNKIKYELKTSPTEAREAYKKVITSVYLYPHQLSSLRKINEITGTSMAAMIRRAIDGYLAKAVGGE